MLRWLLPMALGIILFAALPVVQAVLELIGYAPFRTEAALRDHGFPYAQPEAFALVTLVLLTLAVARAQPRRRRREPPDEMSS